MSKINLGCGRKYLTGYLNCDVSPNVKADVYFNLDVFPYPLEADSAEEILLDNVLEHLEDVVGVMTELHRILKPGGVLKIIVPYAKSDWAFQDPTHKHFFTERSMDYFAAGSPYNFYAACRFNVLQAALTTDNRTTRQKLRNAIPFRSLLRYWLFNLYDNVYFELQKPPVASPS